MRNNQCTKPIKNPFLYKGIKMRSQFETVIASILDEMHLDFKYDNYISSGLYINRDVLFLPGDKNYRPDYRTIKELISAMIGAIAREYVVRKESPECYTPIHEQTRSI